MNLPRKIPLRVVLGLAAAVLIDTALQIFWKTAVLKLPGEADSLMSMLAIFREPLFIVVICIMSLQFFNWMAVLNHADLSFAQPFTALSYVSVGVISAFFLGEAVDKQQMLGIACVIAGVWFISRTSHITQRDGEVARRPVEHAPSHANVTRELIQREGVCSDY
jgi:drug/metabolite transporter (DMT)-like permease